MTPSRSSGKSRSDTVLGWMNRVTELHYITPMINMQCVPRSKNTLLLEVLEGRSVVLSPVAISALLRCQLACWYRGIVRTLGDCTWQLRTLRARAHILASRRSHGQGFYTLEADCMLSDHSCWQLMKAEEPFWGWWRLGTTGGMFQKLCEESVQTKLHCIV